MNPIVVYVLLLKAVLTSFSGMGSLPAVRQDFVVAHRALDDRQLASAVSAGLAVPGPNGVYLVAVGYFAAGYAGALAACLALMTPPFLSIPLVRFLGRRADHPRVRGAIHGLTIAVAGLLLSAAIPMARSELGTPLAAAAAGVSFLALAFTRVDTLWVIAGAAAIGLAGP